MYVERVRTVTRFGTSTASEFWWNCVPVAFDARVSGATRSSGSPGRRAAIMPTRSAAESSDAPQSPVLAPGRQSEKPRVKKTQASLKHLARRKKRPRSVSAVPVALCDRRTGATHFCSDAPLAEGSLDVARERMASLLAIECLIRGGEPGDYAVLVPASEDFARRLLARAHELLEAARAAVVPASLSLRQKEILHAVIRNRANKEIAAQLNITVRTVKFHISALLKKFGVSNRADLARRAALLPQLAIPGSEREVLDERPEIFSYQRAAPMPANTLLQAVNRASRGVRTTERLLTN